jgi:hypothetical protein
VAFAYLIFIGGILCPLAWLLGQTVPILTNLMLAQRSGEAAGRALYWSTLGSFLGSVTLSLVVMQLFGVWAAVLLGALMLVAGAALVQRPQALTGGPAAGGVAALSVAPTSATAGAPTRPMPTMRSNPWSAMACSPRAFVVNNQNASVIDDSEPPPMPATCSTCDASCSTTCASAIATSWCWAPAASRCRTASR